MRRLIVLPAAAALLPVIVAACGSDDGAAFETLPPIRTTTTTTTPPTTLDPRDRRYIVQSGDNVNEIASAYQVTARSLIELNELDENGTIFPGQELKIPNIRVDTELPTTTTIAP